jgi:hypothetical protein
MVDSDRLTLNPAELTQSLPERLDDGTLGGGGGGDPEIIYPMDAASRLGVSDQPWRGWTRQER